MSRGRNLRLRDKKKAAAQPQVDDFTLAIPVVCDICGRPFPSLVELGRGSSGIGLSDIATRCPREGCDGLGLIPEGIYDFKSLAEDLVAHASGPERQRLLDTLLGLPETASGHQVAAALDEAGSRWKPLADFLIPKHGSQVAGYLSFLVTLLRAFGVLP